MDADPAGSGRARGTSGSDRSDGTDAACDVLVVGAGPTGLALAAQLLAMGVRPRVVDRSTDRTHESRALAIQPRTLEVLRPLGLAEEMVVRGETAVRLTVHAGRRAREAAVFDAGLDDTAFRFLLLLSQARTEQVLGRHLDDRGLHVERGTCVDELHPGPDAVVAVLRDPGGRRTRVRARYVVGCDGLRSTVREAAGIAFTGGTYAPTFLLADADAEGVERGRVHAWLGGRGPFLLFPLGDPAPYRVVTVRTEAAGDGPVTRAELQAVADAATGGVLRLGEPVWTSAFRVAHRGADRYRSGRLLLAGDAAHVHSSAGGQGMNTGIQDAVDLGWMLALVCRGTAPEELLDAYDAERRPVGEAVLRVTDRAFTAATSRSPVVAVLRSRLGPVLLPLVLRRTAVRARLFRVVSQLGIRYRDSPAVDAAGPGVLRPGQRPSLRPGRRGRSRGAWPGDRLPDAWVTRGGTDGRLHDALLTPAFHLLLCGPTAAFDPAEVDALRDRFGPLLTLHLLHPTPERSHLVGPQVLDDPGGEAGRRLGLRGPAVLVVRPDGHVGHRTDGTSDGTRGGAGRVPLDGAGAYLGRWLAGAPVVLPATASLR